MYKAILVPTKKSKLIQLRDEVRYNDTDASNLWIPQDLFITSDEKIGLGDLYHHQLFGGTHFILTASEDDVRLWEAGHKFGRKIIGTLNPIKGQQLLLIGLKSLKNWLDNDRPEDISINVNNNIKRIHIVSNKILTIEEEATKYADKLSDSYYKNNDIITLVKNAYIAGKNSINLCQNIK